MREVAYGMSDDQEETGRGGGGWLIWKLVLWIGGGAVAVIVLLLVVFAAVAIYLGGGMPGISGAPQVGTAASRPTMWLDQPAIVHSSLPNVVILAVMEHESQGQVFARNYNCTIGPPMPKPCGQVYPGGIIHTTSEDAGLMQVNSANWKQYGLSQDPFNPQRNIAAGVAILEADYAKYGYLEYALEAYNSGSGGPNSPDAAYAQAVLADINAYEAGPVLSVWSTLPTGSGGLPSAGQQYQLASPFQSYWLIAEAAGPYGVTPSYTWNTPPITVTTKAGVLTSITEKPITLVGVPWAPQATKCVKDKIGTTTCTPRPPVMVATNALLQPASIDALSPPPPGSTGYPAWLFVQTSPTGRGLAAPPVWPGAQAWAIKETGQDQFTVRAFWRQHSTGEITVSVYPPQKDIPVGSGD